MTVEQAALVFHFRVRHRRLLMYGKIAAASAPDADHGGSRILSVECMIQWEYSNLFTSEVSIPFEEPVYDESEQDAPSMSSPSGRDGSGEIKCIRVDSAFGFGGLYRLADILFRHGEAPRGVVLDMSDIAMLDSAGLRALEYFQSRCRREKVGFLLTEVRSRPLAMLIETALMPSVAKVAPVRRK